MLGLLQIQIGLLNPVSKKPIRVARHVISVSADSTPEVIVAAAVRQMSENDNKFDSSCSFSLHYPDGVPVVTLRKTNEPFILSKYKNQLLKDYSKIVLYLCSKGLYT